VKEGDDYLMKLFGCLKAIDGGLDKICCPMGRHNYWKIRVEEIVYFGTQMPLTNKFLFLKFLKMDTRVLGTE